MSQQEKNTSQSFLAGIEKLVNKSSSCRMFRVSKYATNISENACSRFTL
jgi:hypothetical protein